MVRTAVAIAALTFGAALSSAAEPYLYEEMTPDQLRQAVERCPVAFIPAGIAEWHGEQSACGLDALKAESLCRMAAERLGGVCFPTVWIGPEPSTPFDPEKYPRGTLAVAPEIYSEAAGQILTRIEGLGFRVAVWLSGHYPGVIPSIAGAFNRRDGMKVVLVSENKVVKGMPAGDHAAAWETSLLMVLRPGLVDLTRLPPLPPTTKPAGPRIPDPWRFDQRKEYYGIYGADPRIWANTFYGQRGAEAVLDGLAARIRDASGDPSYGQQPRAIRWPADDRRSPEVRYEHLLPYQWFERFEQAPIVFWPMVAAGDATDKATQRAAELAGETGGMVFPAFAYGPRNDASGVALSAAVYEQATTAAVSTLKGMGFRIIVLLPSPSLNAGLVHALEGLSTSDGQTRVLVAGPSESTSLPTDFEASVRAMIPRHAKVKQLTGSWLVNGNQTVQALSEEMQNAATQPVHEPETVYELSFTLSDTEARGAVLLDLGKVANCCNVTLNDTSPLVDHWPPYRLFVTGRVKPGRNTLKVIVRHRPQETLDKFFYRAAPPRLRGPVTLRCWGG